MKKLVLVICTIVVLFSSGCSFVGKGAGPSNEPKVGAIDPDALRTPVTGVPTAIIKSGIAQATATKPSSAGSTSTGGEYVVAEKPATGYTYEVSAVIMVDGKIVSRTLKTQNAKGEVMVDESKVRVAESAIRWSDRYAIDLWNRGFLRNWVSSVNPTWEEMRGVAIWIIWGCLWDTTSNPKVDIDSYVGSVAIPPDSRYVDRWLQLTYCVNLNRESPWLKNALLQVGGIKPSDFPAPRVAFDTSDEISKVIPKVIEVAKVKGWGG